MKQESSISWHNFYDACMYDDQKVSRAQINKLIDIDHDEGLEVIEDLTFEDETLAQALFMQAIRDGVLFTIKDLIDLNDTFYDESLLYEGIKLLSKFFTKQDYEALLEVYDTSFIIKLMESHHLDIDVDELDIKDDDFDLATILDILDQIHFYLTSALADLREAVSGGIFDTMETNLILATGKLAYQQAASSKVECAKVLLDDLEIGIKELKKLHKMDLSVGTLQALTDVIGNNKILKNDRIYKDSKAGKQLLKIIKKIEKARNELLLEYNKETVK